MGETSIPCTKAVRDRLADDKPDDVSWSEFLDALHKDAEFIVVNDDIDVEAMVAQLIDDLGATAGGPQVDDSDIAHDVVRRFDYAELATAVVDELEARQR